MLEGAVFCIVVLGISTIGTEEAIIRGGVVNLKRINTTNIVNIMGMLEVVDIVWNGEHRW